MGNIVSEVIIAKYVRSPFTPAKKGLLKDIRADDLASQTIKKMLENQKSQHDLFFLADPSC